MPVVIPSMSSETEETWTAHGFKYIELKIMFGMVSMPQMWMAIWV